MTILVEFPEHEADFLASAFFIDGKYYGKVDLFTTDNLISIKEMQEEVYIDKDSCLYMSPNDRTNIELMLGYSKFYAAKDESYYSDLGIKLANLDPTQLEYVSECTLFFKTKEAQEYILTMVKEPEVWEANLARVNKKIADEAVLTVASIEFPYVVYLYGDDDSSYTCVKKTKEEALEFIKNMTRESVFTEMVFTN